ncbi:MAG: hypothetical protein HRT89_00250 [Lentisphaeria bacterium]|nr:hypothetical protein [Lentisphaeria bacterium]
MRNDKMTIKKYLGIILCLLSFWAMADDYEIELVPFDSPHKKLQPRLVQHAMPSIMYWYTLTEGQQSSYAAPYFDWARNIKLDGKPGFEIYQRGKYIDRRPFTRLKLKVGDHTLDPGKHVFTVAKDGTVSTKDEDIVLSTIKGRIAYIPENLKKGINDKGVVTVKRIQSLEEADEESNLIWELTNGDKVKVLGTENGWVKLELAPLHLIKLKLYPISIHATNADLKAPPPKELFYAISLPNVVLRLADDKRLKPEELIFRIRAATKERKNLYKYFEIWLPSNKVGKGYLAFPLKHTFHIDKNGITNGAGGGYDAKWLTNPKAKGIKKYRIDIPVNRVPVYGDALNTCLIANMQFIKIPQFASGDLEYANLYVRNEPYEIRVTEKGPSLSISGNLSDLPNKAIRLGWTDAYKINQKLLLVEAESTHLTAGQKMRVRVRALDPSKSSEAEAEAINTENFIKAMETAYKGIERGINTNLNNIGRASKDLIQLSQVRQKAQKKWSIAAGNLKRALGQEKAILGRVATYTKQVNQFKKQIADAQKKAAAEKDANKKKPLLARVKPIQTRLKAATTNLTKQQAALKKTQVIVAKDKKTEAITKVQHTNEADAHNKLIKQSAKHPKIVVLRKVNEKAKKKLVESQAKIDRYKKILVTQRATRLKRTNYNPLANAPAFAQIRDFNDSNWQPVKVEAASPNAKAGSKEANEWFLTLPSKMRDGIYKLRIGVKPVQKDEQIFHVEQWVTISAGTGLGIGVFTQRSRTAFYRGETFWLALGVLGGTRSIPAGTKIEADLVDENGIRVPIVRETVKSEIKDRKTYVVTLSGEQTLNLAPGTYRVEPKLGTQDGPVFKLYIVDPQPKTNFINMLLGKYNQVGFDYSSLLSGGNAISQRSVQLGGQHADSRLSADMVVKDLAESGYNSFKGMSYGMNRVFFPSSRTIRMLVEERPELGPWEAFAPPSGRDLFLDACVKNNIAFYENLFTQHDSIMPRGEKFLAACDRYSTLEAASMRHSPAFRGLCMYDEFSHSLDHDTAQVVMTHFHKMDEKGFRKKYGYSSSDAQIAMDRFTGRPEGQRDYKDLVKYKAYPKYIDWTWEEFSRRMTNSIHDMMPGSVNFTLARVAAHPGDNLGIGNGNIATVFAPLELATAVGYKDMGGWGAFPLSGPLMADAFRINDTLKSVPMLAGQRTGSYGDSNLRDAFMTLSQKPDGLSFMQYDTSIQTSVGTDHYSTVRDIARNLTTRYGDFILYSKKGYKKVAIYDSREAKFLSIRKSVNVSLANEALWASCLRAGYPADFLTDQQILKDKGMDYDVIIAPGWIFKEEVPPKTLEALKRLKQAGKIIIVEKSSNLPIPGIVRLRLPSVKGAEKEAIDLDEIEDRLGGMFPKYLDVDNERWWKHTIKITAALKETLSKYIPPAAEGHDMLLSPDWLQSQEGSYMIMSNHAYTGFKGNHKTLFQAPQVFDITVIDKPPVCYDMLEMKQVPVKKLANKRSSIKVDMRTYPGKFYAFLPTAIDHLTIKTSPAVAGQNMSFEISITDKSGKMIPAGFPVEIKLTNEKGQILRHVFRSGTPVYKGIYRVPVNCPGNKIKLWARELISGSSCEATAAYIAKPFVPKKSANADVRISEIDKIKRFINEECKVATPLFTAKDIRKPGRLAIRIRKPRNIQQPGRSNWYKDKMSAYIKSKCTEAELKVMHAYDPKKGQSKELYATIVTVLNRIIQDGRLFSKKRFPPGFLTASDNDVGEDVTNPKSFLDINRYLLTKFYSEELIAGEVIYVTTDEKWLVEDAWRLGDMLMAKGYRVRVLPSQAFVRGPARGWNHTDKELPFLDGSRMWRGSVVKPGVFLDGPVIVLGRRWTLANHLIKRDALPEPITENFPGAGRCLVGWVPKAISNYHNTLYVLTNDKDGLKKGIDALINIDKQKANVFIHRPLVKEKATKAAVQMKTFEGNSKDLKSYREMHSDEDRVTAIDTDTATGRSVFGTFGYGKNLFCFDKAGKLLWKTFLPEHNVYYAKWIDGGKKIVASTGHGFFIFILDATNGKVIKKFASTEWPDLHVGEREHNTEVRIILNPPLRQIFVFGATGLLAVDYDGKKMWFKDRVKEIVEYPAEAVQTSFATFGKYLLMEGFEISPDGSKVIYNERLVIGSTYGFAGSIINLWGNQPQIFDAKTGRLLLKSTTADPGTNIKWEVTWGKEGPYIHANSLAAPLLFVNPNRKSGVDPGKLGAFRPPFVD